MRYLKVEVETPGTLQEAEIENLHDTPGFKRRYGYQNQDGSTLGRSRQRLA